METHNHEVSLRACLDLSNRFRRASDLPLWIGKRAGSVGVLAQICTLGSLEVVESERNLPFRPLPSLNLVLVGNKFPEHFLSDRKDTH